MDDMFTQPTMSSRNGVESDHVPPVQHKVGFLAVDDNTQLREHLRVLLKTVKLVRQGNFSVRLPIGHDGITAEIGEVINDIIELIYFIKV